MRGEHIGLHSASTTGGSQHYLSCGQINITGGGSGTPGPLVAFPGAYSASDPGLKINIYYPVVSTLCAYRINNRVLMVPDSHKPTPTQVPPSGLVKHL